MENILSLNLDRTMEDGETERISNEDSDWG